MVRTRSGRGSAGGDKAAVPVNQNPSKIISTKRTRQETILSGSNTQYDGTLGSRSSDTISTERSCRPNGPHKSNTFDSKTHSVDNTSASRKRKRELELKAARKRYEVKARILKEREKLELEMINQQLAADLEEIDDEEMSQELGSMQSQVSTTEGQVTIETPDETTTRNNIKDLTKALIDNIKESSGEVSFEDKTRRYIKRMTVGKNLPFFEGDVLEWPIFKRAFEESTKTIGYNEQENMIR